MRIEASILLPVVLLVIYIAFLGWWLNTKPKATIVLSPIVPAVPIQSYSPQFRDSTKCFDCQCPYHYMQPSHGQAKMTPGF